MERKEERTQQWTRMCVVSEPRLSEVVEAYRDLGLEVRVVPVGEVEMEGECVECLRGSGPAKCWVVYTRPGERQVPHSPLDDLYN